MEDIDFSIDETDPEVTALVGKFSELKAHRILQHYLQTCQSDSNALRNACRQISDILSPPNQKKKKKQKQAERDHEMFFDIFLELVQKIPYSHPAHGYLVTLLKEQFYTTLGWMAYNVRDNGIGMLCEPDSQQDIDDYINSCSFLAQLSAAGEGYLSMAIWTFRQNFEEDRSDNTNEHFSGDVAGCTMWIIYAGQWLFQQMIHSPRPLNSSDEAAWEGGALYTGPVLGLIRWRFWLKGLESASKGTRLNEKTRSLAQKATDLMNAIERANE